MGRRALVTGGGALLLLTGAAVLLGSMPRLMTLFGAREIPVAQSGDPTWVGIAFVRVFAAALVALGLVALGARRLSGQAARAVGLPLSAGLALLTLMTLTQALAIWDTPTAWALGGVMAIACVSFGAWGFAQRATSS